MPLPSLSRSWRLFKDGLDRHLFWIYWLAFKEKGWEVFWGPTLLGVVFGVYTLWHSPALPWFLLYVLAVVFLTGYYLWRVNHVRLTPKLGIGEVNMKWTGIGPAHPDTKRRYVQVPVKCETEGPVKDCRGQLLRISKWVEGDGKWEITHINETLDLEWSFVNDPPTVINLEHGAPRQLNVFWVENTHRHIVTCTRFHPRLASTPPGRFKFDVRVAREECPPVYASFEVTTGNAWCDLSDVHLEIGQK
jgi:hypothetical protein